MSIFRIEIDKIDECESGEVFFDEFGRDLHSMVIGLNRIVVGDSRSIEDIADLSNRNDIEFGFFQDIKNCFTGWV